MADLAPSDCIDLRERFGQRYKVEHEAGRRGERWPDRYPWRFVLPCTNGHIIAFGGELLGATTKNRGPVAGRLRRLDRVQVVQDGEDGINVAFHQRHFHRIAELLKPRRRRRLTAEDNKRLVAAGEATRFRREYGVHAPQNERRRTQTALADSGAA